jgi:quinol monooxygenase YgiN
MQAKPGQEAAVRQQLLALVEPSRRDPGCINYDLHEASEQPGRFLFHENWESKAHLEAHLQKPALRAVLAQVTPLLGELPEVVLWHRVL